MLEVEVKLRVDGLAAVRARLRSLGAVPAPPVLQEDLFFHHPARDLAARDEALRLRREGDLLELTYKGPRRAADAKVREEHTLRVVDDPTPLLAGLGFRPGPRLRKVRERWRLGPVEVALDDVEGVGTFVEVEAVVVDEGEAAAAVEGAVARLGLAGAQRERRAYLELALGERA